MQKFGISQPVQRLEDSRLVKGQGSYVDDSRKTRQLYAGFIRSIVASGQARLENIEALRESSGVRMVVTARDLDAAGIVNDLPCHNLGVYADGSKVRPVVRPLLSSGTVRHVGDIIALVVAESQEQLQQALDDAAVAYESAPAVTAITEAVKPGAPAVHPEFPDNIGFCWHWGDRQAVEEALAGSAYQVRFGLVNNRVAACAMEPRAVQVYPEKDRLIVEASTQGVWDLQQDIANSLYGGDRTKIRVITRDVGGGFGMKAASYPEQLLVAYAGKMLAAPVKWVSSRQEAFLSDSMGRDHQTSLVMGFDRDFHITGYKVTTYAAMGAYYAQNGPIIPTKCAVKILPGVYRIPCIFYEVKAVFVHTVPVDAYRGAGRPESIYALERLMDEAAAELGVDRITLRKKNMITRFPYRTPVGQSYDSGDFPTILDKAVASAGYEDFAHRRAQSEGRGKLRGIGLCYYIESTMGQATEDSIIDFHNDGTVVARVGTQSNGQGHETAYAQILHEAMGVPVDRLVIEQGDTDSIASGGGTGGSRSVTIQGVSLTGAAGDLIARARVKAAAFLETEEDALKFDPGIAGFRMAARNRTVTLAWLASREQDPHDRRAPVTTPRAALYGIDHTALPAWTFPNGCHVAEVEIDTATAQITVVRYSVVDDFGSLINPMLVEGQVHGGVAQGIGQALFESVVYDEAGQLLSGSFMDYALPRLGDMPAFRFTTHDIPCTTNAMGIKGCGEAGTVGALAAVMNAVHDALNAHRPGRRIQIDMPATPLRVWETMQKAALF